MSSDRQRPLDNKSRIPLPKSLVISSSPSSDNLVAGPSSRSPHISELEMKRSEAERQEKAIEDLQKIRVEREIEQRRSDRKNAQLLGVARWITEYADFEIGRQGGRIDAGWGGECLEDPRQENAEWKTSEKGKTE